MKILDLVENIITETDEAILQKLLDKFRKTTGEFNNASHKFYTVRKVVANELEGEEQEAIKKTSPGEFFNYLKSQKNKKPESPKPEIKKEEPPKQDLELRGVTREELDAGETVFSIISKWVDMFHPKYSDEEITDALYNSALGDFEEKPYIRKEVNSAIIKNKMNKREEEDSKARPRIEKELKPTKDQVEALKGSDVYNSVLNDMISMVKNQPRTPGQKPEPAHKLYKYIQNTLQLQYDRKALESFKEGNRDDAKRFVTKREIINNVSSLEYRNWYAQNK